MSRLTWYFALALLFASCQSNSTGTSGSKAAGVSPSALPTDIVSSVTNIQLGSGWYPYETYAGQSFRWVDNDAVFVIPKPETTIAKVAIVLEPGPGLGVNTKAFTLDVIGDGQLAASATVKGRSRVRFDLPVLPGKDNAFRLHVVGGGKKIATDKRVLNFRVFTLADATSDPSLAAGSPDIIRGPDIKLGPNWYPLEQYKGETFRWVDNDAVIEVKSDRRQNRRLELLAAAGPSIKSPGNLQLSVRGWKGKVLQSGTIKGGGMRTIYFNLPLQAGRNVFSLHADSSGRRAPRDTRVLDFRVFTLSVQ
jgi:hypothetical protein